MITVTTPGSARLATAADLQALIVGLSEIDANALIDQASVMIASNCARVLHEQAVSETWRNVSGGPLLPSRWPIGSIASVVVDGVTLDPADYEVDGTFVYRLSNDAIIGWRAQKVVMTYTGGYPANAIPADLKRACLDLCVNLHASQGRDMTLRSVNVPDVEQVSYRDNANGGGLIPDHVMAVISLYKEWRL